MGLPVSVVKRISTVLNLCLIKGMYYVVFQMYSERCLLSFRSETQREAKAQWHLPQDVAPPSRNRQKHKKSLCRSIIFLATKSPFPHKVSFPSQAVVGEPDSPFFIDGDARSLVGTIVIKT